MLHTMESNLKIIVFEDCKAATYEYYVGEEKDIMTVFRLNVDESVWKVVSGLVHEYFQLDGNDAEFDPTTIEYWMLEKANLGYIEEEDIAIYCDTAIGYNYKKNELRERTN